jgi:hypothetical protein
MRRGSTGPAIGLWYVSTKVRMGNYERLFNEARTKVRAWEAGNLH